jgi:hypothetical protein
VKNKPLLRGQFIQLTKTPNSNIGRMKRITQGSLALNQKKKKKVLI